MTIMDAGSWVGDLFQKFESICVEVEEVIYEDTFKYVENRVRNVGETVKKVYSDVMQDLLPSSELDRVKVDDHLSTVVHFDDVKICVEQKKDKKKSVRATATVADEDNIKSVCSVIKACMPTYNVTAGEKCAEESYITKLGSSNKATSVAKDLNCKKDSHNVVISDLPSTSVNNNSGQFTIVEPCDVSNESSSVHGDANLNEDSNMSDDENEVESPRTIIKFNGGNDASKAKKIDLMSRGHMTNTVDGYLSDAADSEELSQKTNLSCTVARYVDDMVQADKKLSTFDIEVLNSYFTCDSERYDANKQGFVIAEQSNEAKLGESCILVEKNDVFSKSGFQDVQKSNKKKIKNVFLPRIWTKSKRNHTFDYEQEGENSLDSTHTVQVEIQKSPTCESFELDWELL
ncbi:uncharacterized protein LOC130823351 [Amaranthus tricolor]|uniref:uncharacterized protein LOC130823351 n=1 Tax=Amaranthus tricolor TaxID=29722 RepID=UPI0025844ED5|nr:uncharacterized protein LOC130823351 [Amaranthus tricolor]XP_057543959.1 uncharacterized protein LOC130823351 [Amaranthus tricolor]